MAARTAPGLLPGMFDDLEQREQQALGLELLLVALDEGPAGTVVPKLNAGFG